MFKEELKEHFSKFNTSPFLFIGSGFSRRYMGLPCWEDLLKESCANLGLSKPFNYYKSNANSNLPRVASLMGKDFNSVWWESESFVDSRTEFEDKAQTEYSPLKYEISKRIRGEGNLLDDEKLEKELKLIKKVNIDGVITTNWDCLIESVFPDFNKYIGQEELIFSELFSIGELYKIHGCISNPNTLILTEEDYKLYHERNSYLAAKLLTIFIENPIVFIGYSLDDSNIQEILKSILKCLTKEKVEKLKDRLVFCQWSPEVKNPTITDSSILISETVIPIKLVSLESYNELFTVLANNRKKMPIKVLRQMKGMVYDFVKTSDSKHKVYVTDNLENLEDVHNAEFVYGVGLRDKLSEKGIKGLELVDILTDAVIPQNYNPEKIAKLSLPYLATTATYIPYFKHLREGNFLNNEDGIDEESDIKEFSPGFIGKVNALSLEDFKPKGSYLRKEYIINEKYASFDELKNDCELYHTLIYTPLLQVDKIDLKDLIEFLQENVELLNDSRLGTHYRKLVCLYDFLHFKLQL
ncbi:SIR2 family protein [Autumnicola psychrophila]|uniref:SIR2 family protein n=1 Tax=Autumnicola psychrophila TaxID=3075592 RepID=A0ABU3DPX6_9FLAO|nr:SIR2 family protein [Zunongwangia sp. F225]MDT0685574.1 SIR2 family protein [Zunongwangia sp. F225]